MSTAETGRLNGDLFTECAGWIWEQLSEEGFHLSGELVELILLTERELAIHTRPLPEVAQLLADEFRLRGISTSPYELDAPLIEEVLRWEDDFLGFAEIPRADS
ncbi:MAG: hypothetical protein ACRDHF_09815 [Tepidiformaceae bacterium]